MGWDLTEVYLGEVLISKAEETKHILIGWRCGHRRSAPSPSCKGYL
jgi:hypothetical protein